MSRLAWVYLALVYGFIFLPVAVLVLFSFQDGRLPVPPFEGPVLDWYADVLSDRRLTEALLNSVVVAIASSFVACLLGFLAAQALAQVTLPGSALVRAVLIAPMTVSMLIVGLGLLILFNYLGVGKSLWTVGIGHVVLNLPLCFAILYAATGPAQVRASQAARDLGASEWAVVQLVAAPMAAPALLAAFVLSVTFSWDEFLVAFLLSRFDVTLPVEIWSLLRSGLSPRLNAIGSVVFLASVVLVVAMEIAVFARRRP